MVDGDDPFELMVPSNDDKSRYLENSEEDQQILPRMTLVHALSEAVEMGDAKADTIIYSPTGKEYAPPGKPFAVIPLFYWRGRILFPPRETGATQPICKSIDGKRGMGLPGGECITCDKAVWQKDSQTGKNVRPPCVGERNFAFWIPGSPAGEEIAVCSFTKTSERAGRNLLNRLRALNKPPFAYTFMLNSKQEESNGNRFWVLDLDRHEDTNRIEKTLDKFDADGWQELYEKVKTAAALFSEDQKEETKKF